MKRSLVIALLVACVLSFPRRVGDRHSNIATMNTVKAIKAIASIHTAETQYYAQTGRWGRLTDLGSQGADLISPELALGHSAQYEIRVAANIEGYEIRAWPRTSECRECSTFYSDQTMTIRTSSRSEPASSSSPILGNSH
jgi:hypothetical protein